MSNSTLGGHFLAVAIVGFVATVAYAGKGDQPNATGKDDKKDSGSKSDSKGSSASRFRPVARFWIFA